MRCLLHYRMLYLGEVWEASGRPGARGARSGLGEKICQNTYVLFCQKLRDRPFRVDRGDTTLTKSATGTQTRGADPPKERKRNEKVPKTNGRKKLKTLKRPRRDDSDINEHRSTRRNLSRKKIQFSICVFELFRPTHRNGRSVATATTTKSAACA